MGALRRAIAAAWDSPHLGPKWGMPKRRPAWWGWELEFSSHVLKRMVDRRFTEVDLRRMLHVATSIRRDIVENRWVVMTRHRHNRWEVIVEPDHEATTLVIITAYQAE